MEREVSQNTPNDLGRSLHGNGLKMADVTAYSRLTGLNRTDASRALVNMEVKGRNIAQARGGSVCGGKIRRSRIDAATQVFTGINS